ncbi:MAG: outer membrane protein transport protein [Gammaproteobacteria bacterium]|nr:outer membrane protein transport protein [Gammaproteobacteria bacterium]
MRVLNDRSKRVHGTLCAMTLVFAASTVEAGGLWIRDFGTTAQGRASAGEAAGVKSAGTVAHNPAGLALLEKNEFAASGFAFVGDIEFDVKRTTPVAGTGDGGDLGSTAPAGGLGYAHKLNERWTLGFSVAGLTGAEVEYDDDWVGRYQAQKVTLVGIAAVPGIAWRATDKLSIGLALPVLYTDLELDVAIPNLADPINGPDGQASIDGDDTNVGVQLGAIYQFNQRTRVGLMYLSEFDQSFSGDLELNLQIGSAAVGVETNITFAQMIRVGLAHELNSRYTLYLGAGWEDWSEFEDVLISTQSRGFSIPTNWDDTWHGSIGLKYRHNDAWEFQAGFAYDTDPTRSEDRRADLPVDRQIRVATGFTWTRNARWRFGGFFQYIDLGEAELSSGRVFGGEYDPNRIFLIGANLQYFPSQ